MLVADFLFLVIVVYLAYRFIFNFLIPIVRATHQVRQQFRDARGSSRGPENFGGPTDPGSADARSGKAPHKPSAEDYIDFEEVK
jgi:hypothetical protein